MKSNIVLVGFMGSGKSVIARTLSKVLDMELIDTDYEIEKEAGITINEIFKEKGEKYFRDLETEMAKRSALKNNCIISTGGGIVLREENRNYLKESGDVFLLWAGAEETFERLKTTQNRPLLKVENPLEKIRELLNARKEVYEASYNYKIETEGKKIEDISEEIREIYLKK